MASKKPNYNPKGKGGFGDHPENINRRGTPRTFTALRELAMAISHEVAKDDDGRPVLVGEEDRKRAITVAEMILRRWANSSNPALVKSFVEYAFGKVPDVITFDPEQLKAYVGISPDDWDKADAGTNPERDEPGA